jgi:hypothetical protein
MKKALLPLIAACDGKGKLEGCPILAALEPACYDSIPTKTSAEGRI